MGSKLNRSEKDQIIADNGSLVALTFLLARFDNKLPKKIKSYITTQIDTLHGRIEEIRTGNY